MRVEQLSSGVKPRLLKLPGTPEVSGAETRSGGFEAETGEAFEDDTGQVIPVPDQVSEHADKERLLDQACEDVVVGAPRPEQCRDRTSVVEGKSGSVRVDLGGRRIIQNKRSISRDTRRASSTLTKTR